jgi:hypothetical protein
MLWTDGGRAVVFIREIVPRAAIAFTARALYNENYVARPMSHRLEWADDDADRLATVAYRWNDKGRDLGLRLTIGGGYALPRREAKKSSSSSTTGATPRSAMVEPSSTGSSIHRGAWPQRPTPSSRGM